MVMLRKYYFALNCAAGSVRVDWTVCILCTGAIHNLLLIRLGEMTAKLNIGIIAEALTVSAVHLHHFITEHRLL